MLEKIISDYKPRNEQEKQDLIAMLEFFEKHDNYLSRDNLIAHVTSSAIVMNETLDKVLFVYHNIYNSWSWVGGHNDGDEDCLYVAIKEAKEETGLTHVRPLTEDIAGIDIIYVMPHRKNGKHVSDHLHLNLTYILIADEAQDIQHKADENSDVRWFDKEEVFDYVTEPRMIPIYKKMLQFVDDYINKTKEE